MRFAVLALCGLLLFSAGCTKLKKSGAAGSSREISIFYNVDREGPVMEALRTVYEYDIDVVMPERAFVLDPVPFDRFGVHRVVKNQIFLVDLSRDDQLARAVPGMLGDQGRRLFREGRPFRLLVRDQWAEGQTTLFLVGRSTAELETLLTNDVDEQRDRFEQAVVRGLTKTLYALGEETSLEKQVARDYGWTLRIPTGYTAAADPEGRFVKFSVENPVRVVLVHWLEEELPLEAASWRPVLDNILTRYNDQDYVLDEASRVGTVDLDGVPALRWEGVWQNDKYTIGGPFRALAFRENGRSWLLIGQVFNPGHDKVPSLRQVDAIIHTFRAVS